YWPEIRRTACGHNQGMHRHGAVDGLDLPLREETPFREGIRYDQQTLVTQQTHDEVLLDLIWPNHLDKTVGDALQHLRRFLLEEDWNHTMLGKAEVPVLGQCPAAQLACQRRFARATAANHRHHYYLRLQEGTKVCGLGLGEHLACFQVSHPERHR